MNALSAAAAQAVAPPAPAAAPRGEAPAERPFDGHLADATQARTRSGAGTEAAAGPANADAPADDASPGKDGADPDAQPGLPGLSPWASYLPPPAAPPPAGVACGPDDGSGEAAAASAPTAALAAGAGAAGSAATAPADASLPAPAAGVVARPAAAGMRAGPADASQRAAAPAAAAQPAMPPSELPEPMRHAEAIAPPAVLQESATVPVNVPGSHLAAPPAVRGESPAVPGTPVPLHAGALQDRLDTALRWMAAGGLQAAQLRVDPDALGPITVHLRLDGDIANVVFGSNHEQTRQALESSLAGLKDVLAAGGLHLGQASVGSEQQSGFLAARQFAGREAPVERQENADGVAAGAAAGIGPGAQASAMRGRTGNGMIDLYA